jgi:NADH-quinone oxidoreductase subunit G/NADP-reducing hydrogenase subunit HndD
MREVAAGTSPYHFIEVMGCPGGCINGGGQPRPAVEDYRYLRTQALYREDEGKPLRKSHENPDLTELYEVYLGSIGGHRAHHLLHTTYTARGLYNELLEDE